MKKILLAVVVALLFVNAQAQNVGIGTNTPQTKLDINGALSARVTDMAAAATVDIPADVTLFRLTNTAGGVTTVLNVINPKEGQFLTVINEDDNAADLNGYIIPAGSSTSPGIANFVNIGGVAVGWKQSADNNTGANAFTAGSGLSWNGNTLNSAWTQTGNNLSNNNTGTVGIGTSTPNSSAILDVTSTTQGILPPRMTTAQRDLIDVTNNLAVQGMMIYNTTTKCLESFIGTTWQPIGCGCTSAPAVPGVITGPSPVCQGYTNYTFSVAPVAGASAYTWTLPPGASIANGSGTTAITVNFASTAAGGAQNVQVAASNSCGTSTNSTLGITVNTIPTITTQPTNATICAFGAGSTGNASFTVLATGTTLNYQWQVNRNDGNGFVNITTGAPHTNFTTATLNITGATTAMNGYQYQCLVGGYCAPSVTTTAATLTVNPVPVLSNTTAVTCSNAAFAVTPTGSVYPAGTTFSWGAPTGSGFTGGATGTAQTTINGTLVNAGTVSAVTATYTVTPTSPNGCVGGTFTVTVTVNPTPQVTAPTAAASTSCNGGTQAAITLTTINNISGGSFSFNWTRTSNNNTGVSTGATGVTSLASFSGTNGGTAQLTEAISVTPIYTSGGQTCIGNPVALFNYTVAPSAIANLTNAPQTRCVGTAALVITPSTTATGGIVTYPWTNNTTAIGMAASGTGATTAFTTTNTGTTELVATVTYTPLYTINTVGCSGTPNPTTITVLPKPVMTITAGAAQTRCTGVATADITTSTTATGAGVTTYPWTATNTTSGIAASGLNTPIASFTTTNAGLGAIVSVISFTPTYTLNSVTCANTVVTTNLTVNPVPVMTVSAGATQTKCTGTASTLITPSSTNTGGTNTFPWTNNNTTIGLGASGTGAIAAFTTGNTGTTEVAATVTYTPTYTLNSVSCNGTVVTPVITVLPKPVMAITAGAAQVNCPGTATTAITTSTTTTGAGVTTYPWTATPTTTGIAASGLNTPIAAFTATNAGTVSQLSSTISFTPTYTLNSVACANTVVTTTLAVNPTPQVNAVTAAASTSCDDGTQAIITPTTTNSVSGGSFSFNWSRTTSNGTGVGTGGTGVTSLPSFTASNNGTAPLTDAISVTPIYTAGGKTCTGSAVALFSYTVAPKAVANLTNAPQTRCVGAAALVITPSTTATGGTVTYPWTNNTTATGMAASGTGATTAFTTTNTGTAELISTVTYTPLYTINTVGCSGTPNATTITVLPKPTMTITAGAAQSRCPATATVDITTSSNMTGAGVTTYPWVATPTTTGIAASGSNTPITSFTTTNAGSTSLVSTITFTPTYTLNSVACAATTLPTTTLTVTPTPAVTTAATASVCTGSATSIALTANVASSYAWTVGTITNSIIGASNGSGSTIAQTLSTPNSSNGTVVYNVVPTSTVNSCVGNSYPITVTVNATSVLGTASNAGPVNFCDGTVAQGGTGGTWSAVPTSVSGNVGTVTWQYGWSNTGITGSAGAGWQLWAVTGASPAYCCFPPKVAASDGQPDRVRWSAQNGACPATSYSSAILVQNRYTPAPTSVTASATTACSGSSVTLTANFAYTVSILGTVEFATTCGGAPFASVTPGNNVTSVSTTVTLPVGVTTYYARYNPGTGTSCSPTTCQSIAITGTASITPGGNSQAFNYTGALQTFTVPCGITSVTIQAYGAQGGTRTGAGGLGGYATGTLAVTPGTVLNIYVGSAGTNSGTNVITAGGYNGGGSARSYDGTSYGSSGGGASDVRVGGTALGNRIIVAGGGGGGGYYTGAGSAGGAGGGTTGGAGIISTFGTYGGGGGGTPTAGGAAGGGGGSYSFAGTSGQGANQTAPTTGGWSAGAGGGGYWGGGSGGALGAGGGGGSSYTGGVTSGSTTAGLRTGNGIVTILY